MDQQTNIPIIKPETVTNSIPQNQIPISRPSVSPVTPVPQPVKPATMNTVIVKLPSQGYFYAPENPLSSGEIEICQPNVKHEDILTSQKLVKSGKVLDELLKSLIVTQGISLDDVYVGDKNKIFVSCRIEMYGKDYEIKIKCPSCGEESKDVVDLSLLKDKEFDFSKYSKGVNRFEFELPYSKKRITYKLLTHKDEQAIDSELKALEKFSKGGTASPEITTRLKTIIIALDGNEDRNAIKKFVDEMNSKDSLSLRKYIRANSPDIDMEMNFTCSSCNHYEKMGIPLGISFFWPSIES